MKIVLALGGNALGNNPKEQLEQLQIASTQIVKLIKQGHTLIIGHGNGPQVGAINNAFNQGDSLVMPFAECNAMSQGYIGYHIVQSIRNELLKQNIHKNVIYIPSQTLVDEDDQAFNHPTKPIGGYFSKETAMELAAKTGHHYMEDSGRGYRRIVASPTPKKIVEIDTINSLSNSDTIIITGGGGGVPVIFKNNQYYGVGAVIDKDSTCSLIAKETNADILMILTSVDCVSVNFGKPDQKKLHKISCQTAQQYIDDGEFGVGSMLPKIQAAIDFAQNGKTAVITSLQQADNIQDNATIIQN